jgi:hypothetical protein
VCARSKSAPGIDPQAETGLLVTRQHLEKVRSYVDLGVEEGAKLVVDGRGLKLQGYENGFFLGGCLFDEVKPEMRIYEEEIFGPVLSVVRTPDFDSATKLVNDHEYGNGVAIFTRDGDAAREFTNRIQIGMVGINVPIPVPMAFHSFGDWKRSLLGEMAVHGMEGVRFYIPLTTLTARWSAGIRAGAEYVMPTIGEGGAEAVARSKRSASIGIGGFEEGELEGDSATEEVAAQIGLRGTDAVQLGAQEIDEGAQTRAVVQHSPFGMHKIGRQRPRRA